MSSATTEAGPVPRYARVCVDVAPAHLDRPFDYRVPDGTSVRVGQRVRVRFAGRRRTGWVVDCSDEASTDPARIRDLDAVDGEVAWFDAADLRVFRWVAERFAGTLAAVLRHALPRRVAAVEREMATWGSGEAVPEHGAGRPGGEPAAGHATDRAAASFEAGPWSAYDAASLLAAIGAGEPLDHAPSFWWRPLPGEDIAARTRELVAACVAAGRAALVLAPDRASPIPAAVLDAAGSQGADLRAEGDRDRYRAFLRCRTGQARVAVGERAAALTPVRDLGLVVVIDEANPAYKERRTPRHHAREAALVRGRFGGAPVVVTGDLPSPRVWRLVADGHVSTVAGARAPERDAAPVVEVVDRSQPGGSWRRMGDRSSRRIAEALRAGGAVVLVAARGGEGAALACRSCGLRRACPVCAGSVRPTRGDDEGWECAACGWHGRAFACEHCGAGETSPLAAGAGRLARELAQSYPDAEVARMEGFDAPGPARRPAIAVMTRGSVVTRPAWLGEARADVVVLPDADGFLRRATLDASEDALRLWFAVGRWADRVVLETREPTHPAVQALVRWDPEGFWRAEAERRAELRYPPAASIVRVSAPADEVAAVTGELREALPASDEVLGPAADGALIVKADDLRGTLAALVALRHEWSSADRKVRIDVDPLDVG